jgi:uncharacterized protein
MTIIEVIYIPTNHKPVRLECELKPQMTVENVLEQSGLYKNYPEAKTLAVGIFSRLVSLDTLVKPGDRVEVYRPLTLEPMEKRRQRARTR